MASLPYVRFAPMSGRSIPSTKWCG